MKLCSFFVENLDFPKNFLFESSGILKAPYSFFTEVFELFRVYFEFFNENSVFTSLGFINLSDKLVVKDLLDKNSYRVMRFLKF